MPRRPGCKADTRRMVSWPLSEHGPRVLRFAEAASDTGSTTGTSVAGVEPGGRPQTRRRTRTRPSRASVAREGGGVTACLGKPVSAADLRALVGGLLQLDQRSS